ncbi:tetratricopeptide repeat protein [Synechococcus sp. PCC 7336]|uniref:O-linked N-acetylglucosamine transferase family protein n=1 Tax=Synechococcus sp. PCC 7336 TaxID=195250 RepID=UPI000348B564|nr:tetratricopeptide repeat protein [Synechococcus sp. PCC 7336]
MQAPIPDPNPLDLGIQYYESGQWLSAEDCLKQLLDIRPTQAEAWYILGLVGVQKEQYLIAEERLRLAIALQPSIAKYHCALGNLLQTQTQLKEASESYRAAIAIDPEYTEAHFNLELTLAQLSSYQTSESGQSEGNQIPFVDTATESLDRLLGSANRYRKAGQLDEAEAQYRRLVELYPGCADGWYSWGLLALDRHRDDIALERISHALELDPDNTSYQKASISIALNYHQSGNIQAAQKLYWQVLNANPKNPDALHLLGVIADSQKDHRKAIQLIGAAVGIDPALDLYKINLSVALLHDGQPERSIEVLSTIKQPTSLSHRTLAEAYTQTSQWFQVESSFIAAINLTPEDADLYESLGKLQVFLKKYDLATEHLQKALSLGVCTSTLFDRLCRARLEQGELEAALDIAQRGLAHFPGDRNLRWFSELACSTFFETEAESEIYRKRHLDGLEKLDSIQSSLTAEDINVDNYLFSNFQFYLSYQGKDDIIPIATKNSFTHALVQKYFSALNSNRRSAIDRKKIRIGYISWHMRRHSVGKLFLGWLEQADRSRFEIYSYCFSPVIDDYTERYKQASDRFVCQSNELDFKQIAKLIAADALDILVYLDLGMEPLGLLVASLKLAPIQCVAWGHPLTTGLPTIDYFLSGDLMEPQDGEAHYTETLIRLPGIGTYYDLPEIPDLTASRSSLGIAEGKIFYLSCQSLHKYLPQYDYLFAEIALRVPHARFLFLATFSKHYTGKFARRMARAFEERGLNFSDYCEIAPQREWAEYCAMNKTADVFLDTFAWSGGVTTLEAIACGLPIVTCPGRQMRGRHAYGILQTLGVTATVASTPEEYVEIACKLGSERQFRDSVVEEMQAKYMNLYRN